MKINERLLDGSPFNLFKKVPILESTFDGVQLRVFQPRILLITFLILVASDLIRFKLSTNFSDTQFRGKESFEM